MGLSELVLKVPASDEAPNPPSEAPNNANPAHSNTAQATTKTNLPKTGQKVKLKPSESKKTHSRESSGASNLSVRFSVNDETISTRPPRSSEEDITLSDRLSQDLEELDEDDDGFHPGSKSCESIPHDRLTPFDRGMR